ncbi:hypothetical protein EJB05_24683 [Eragrostis curvula]|uniref:DOG1 domain-containing protein n=1 Tax=Eragrostis curvula TaxID=38414 RepID=A0A5J9VBA4_9POAL|nr:hypothetical protein EJB05_24683 [Eragrostis curvula]
MGDKPWQQPHEQASYPHARMIQASSSSIHGSTIRKDPGGYDMAEFDQALFLYLNSQDQTSVIQEHPQTLNIFPSEPMHVVETAPTKQKQGSMATNNRASDNTAGPSKRLSPSIPPSKPTPAAVKREGNDCSSGSKGSGTPSTSDNQEVPRTRDAKTLRRLAQNREAARKSRLRKKGGVFGGGALSGGGIGGLSPEAAWFDAEHARWVEEHGKIMRHLRAALEEPHDAQLRQLVDAAAAHHGVLAELKAAVARADAFHIVSGTWAPAAERCFLWVGGFRPSDLVKVAARHAEPLTEAQAVDVCGLQQWARDAEAALDHELQAMHRSVSEAVSSDAASLLSPYTDVPGYMATMSLAIAKLSSLETFVRQADVLRLQTLHRLPQILTMRQSARCFLAIADYSHRLRALSELWVTRPRQESVTAPATGSSHRPNYLSMDTLL